MRASIMKGLRKAGDRLRNADDAYADFAGRLVMGDNPGVPRTVAGMLVGAPATRLGQVATDGTNGAVMEALLKMAPYGAPAVGAGIRYGLPAAGAYAAVQGLTDVLQQNNQADIDMNQQAVRYAPMVGM